MVVFTRKEGEAVVIGQDIELTLLELGDDIAKFRLNFPLKPENLFIEFWTGEKEEVKIGDQITVLVTMMLQGRLRVGIEAPTAVRIMRKELLTETPKGITQGAAASSTLSPAPTPRGTGSRAPTRQTTAAV